MRILHVGCGRKKLDAAALLQHVGLSIEGAEAADVLHLDADGRLQPDIRCTLGLEPIPLDDDAVDIVIAWHVLEHIGRQGETLEWFRAFEELYRVLKPGGLLYAECPYYTGIWAWSDPTHVRAISEHSFVFFNQDAYRTPGSIISPYRIATDLQFCAMAGMPKGHLVFPVNGDPRNTSIRFCLSARKPLRPWWEDNAPAAESARILRPNFAGQEAGACR